MTAPTLNIASIAAPGAGRAATSGSAQGAAVGGQLAGFDALLAALFPVADPQAAATSAPPAAAAGTLPVRGETAKGEADPDAETAPAGEAEAAPASDPTALAASLLAPAVVAPEAPVTTTQTTTPELRGRLKAAAQASHLPDRALPPGLATAADTQSEDAAATPDTELPATHQPRADAGKPAAPPAWGRDKTPGAPAQPALDNANPKADLAAKAAAAEAPDAVEPAPAPAPAPDAAPPTQIAEAAKHIATPTSRAEAAPAKSAKAERKAEAASAEGPRPRDPAAKSATAKAPEATAKAADAPAEVFEPSAPDEEAPADQADAAPQGETRATAQSSGASAQTPQAVRGAPETVATLAAQIVKKLEERSTRFDLELDPAGLGRVDVRIEIGAQGKLTASMLFDNPQAAHELKARAAELQRALEQAGFDTSGGLSFQWSDNGRHQGQAWQDEGLIGRGAHGRAFQAALGTAGEAAEAANHGALRLRRGVNAGVDVRI